MAYFEAIHEVVVAQRLVDARDNMEHLVTEARESAEGCSENILAAHVRYEGIVSCLCLSWHRRWMSNAMIGQLKQSEFVLLGRSVPQWDSRFKVVPLVSALSSDRPDVPAINIQTRVVHELQNAMRQTKLLLHEVRKGRHVSDFDTAAVPFYGKALCSLCRSWWCRVPHIKGRPEPLESEAELLETLVPDWGIAAPLRLVPLDWRFVAQYA